jgi:hypothetical protein
MRYKEIIIVFFVAVVFLIAPIIHVIHVINIRALLSAAAVDGARIYSTTLSANEAAGTVYQYLRNENLVPRNTALSPVQDGKRYLSFCPYSTTVNFIDDDAGVTCTVTYNILNSKPFRNFPKLSWLDSPDPWPVSGTPFIIKVTAKHQK